jgi:hypothetical protein
MSCLPIVTQAATSIDAGFGRTLITLLGSLGAGCTVIAAARWYVGFLKSKGERERWVIENFKGSHTDLQRNFQDQLDRLSDQNMDTQQEFQTYVAVMSDIQNMVLLDVITTMKNIEKINDGSKATVHRLNRTIEILRSTDHGIDSPHRDATDRDI